MKSGLTEEQMQEMRAMGVRFYDSPEEAEMDYLPQGLKRTPDERWLF